MTRKGAAQRPWTTDEIAYLIGAAGRIPRRDICRELRRGKRSVESMVRELRLHGVDVTLRCFRPRLVWCDECASWRTCLDARTGKCRVCTMRDRLAGREDACAEALASMDPAARAVYEKSEAKRMTRKIPQRPVKRESCPVSRYEREKADDAYLRAMEQWEWQCLKLRYDAAKTRLRRMREVTGTNPRKNRNESVL